MKENEAEDAREPSAAPSPHDSPLRRASNWVGSLPSWAFLAGLGVFILLLWLFTFTGPDNFVTVYIWDPIVEDEGYNKVNTVLLMVVLAFVLGWVYRLMAELKEHVDLELTVAVVPYLVWGSVYRVLEDSDLFGPFAEDIAGTGSMLGSSCVPAAGGSFLHHCFGVFFITPIIYVIVTIIAVLIFWLGHVAKRVGERTKPEQGLRFVALTMVAAFALYLALWAGPQTFIRWIANPVVALAALLVAFWIVWRDTKARGSINPRMVMLAYGVAFLIVGLYYVFVYMTGGREGWAPGASDEVQWWVLFALIYAPILVCLASSRIGRALSGKPARGGSFGRRVESPGKHIAILMTLVVLVGGAAFLSILALDGFEQHLDDDTLFSNYRILALLIVQFLIGPAAVWAAAAATRRMGHGNFGVHPAMFFFAAPVNLLMVYGQSADALMTSLGLDVFGYSEKHVLPGFLIEKVREAGLPPPWGDYSAALVMIPLKILIVLAVVWLIDISSREDAEGRGNLVGLVKLAIIMVGLSPGVRDAVRLAMAT